MMKIFLRVVAFFTLLCATKGFSNQLMMGPQTEVEVTGTSTKFLNQNNLRAYLMVINTGSEAVYLKFGSTIQTSTEGIPLPAGWFYENTEGPSNAVWLVTASSTSTVIYMEGQ